MRQAEWKSAVANLQDHCVFLQVYECPIGKIHLCLAFAEAAGFLEFLGDRCGLLKLTSVLFLLSKDDVDDVLREAASQLLAKGELGGALAAPWRQSMRIQVLRHVIFEWPS